MLIDTLPDVQRLTRSQKYELASELWDEVAGDPEIFAPRPEVLNMLEARYQDWKQNPGSAVSWEELQRKLGKL